MEVPGLEWTLKEGGGEGRKGPSGGGNVWSQGVWAYGVRNREPQKVLKQTTTLVCDEEDLSGSSGKGER